MIRVLLLASLLAVPPAAPGLGVEDVPRLHAAGIPADVILAAIRAAAALPPPTADDLLRLREAGLPDEVLRALAGVAVPAIPGYRRVEREGGVLLTDLDEDGRPILPSAPRVANVIPAAPRAERLEPAAARGRTPLPPDEIPYEPEPWVRSSPIGWRWHPSWDAPAAGYPTGAAVVPGWGYPGWGWGAAGGGYFFLPAAYTANGPSHFGRFGFFLPGDRAGGPWGCGP